MRPQASLCTPPPRLVASDVSRLVGRAGDAWALGALQHSIPVFDIPAWPWLARLGLRCGMLTHAPSRGWPAVLIKAAHDVTGRPVVGGDDLPVVRGGDADMSGPDPDELCQVPGAMVEALLVEVVPRVVDLIVIRVVGFFRGHRSRAPVQVLAMAAAWPIHAPVKQRRASAQPGLLAGVGLLLGVRAALVAPLEGRRLVQGAQSIVRLEAPGLP